MSTAFYAQGKRVENLHLTRERDRRRGRELATWLAAGLPVAFALLAYAALQVETVRVGYARESRMRRVQELDHQNRRLRAEFARVSSPDRISKLASERRLHPPLPGQMQYVEPPKAEARR